MKAIQNKLVKCFLHPAKSSANNATNKSESPLLHALFGSAISTARIHTPSLLLPLCQDNSAITTATHAQNLLLLYVQDDTAITMATHTNSKLQLIVGCSHKALIKLIVKFISTPKSLFLLRNEDNSELSSLLLCCIKDNPAIMTGLLPTSHFS